jgi:hypothetical protein
VRPHSFEARESACLNVAISLRFSENPIVFELPVIRSQSVVSSKWVFIVPITRAQQVCEIALDYRSYRGLTVNPAHRDRPTRINTSSKVAAKLVVLAAASLRPEEMAH